MYKILDKNNLKFEREKLKSLMNKYYQRVKDIHNADSFLDSMTEKMFVFLTEDSYAICERTFNPVDLKSYLLIWNIYAPKRGKELFDIIENESKTMGIDVVGYWSTEPEKFVRLSNILKTGLKLKLGLFEKEVKLCQQ